MPVLLALALALAGWGGRGEEVGGGGCVGHELAALVWLHLLGWHQGQGVQEFLWRRKGKKRKSWRMPTLFGELGLAVSELAWWPANVGNTQLSMGCKVL